MAAERTTRLRIYTWQSDSDEFTRDQMTKSHEAIEDRVGQFFSGSTPPAINLDNPAERLARSLWLDTDDNVVYFFTTDGTWRALNAFAAPTSTLTPNVTTNSAGSATTYARSDHSHAMLPFGVEGEVQTVRTTAAAGSLDKYARADHVHIIDSGAINSSAQLVDGVVTTAKIAAGGVTTDRLSAGAVTKTRLSVDQQLPTGLVLPYTGAINTATATNDPTGSGVPAGWLLCNGGLYSTTAYPDLFALIGYSYGGSGGVFGVPNLTNRVVQGVGTTPLGGAGGGTATLTTQNMPAHNHSLNGITLSTHSGHTHAPGSLATTQNSGTHTHQVPLGEHNHGIVPSQTVPLFYQPGSSQLHVQLVGPGFLTSPIATVLWNYTGGASGSGTATTNTTGSAHSHNVTRGTTEGGGSHTHTLSGSLETVGQGQSFDVTPAHVGMYHIIKT